MKDFIGAILNINWLSFDSVDFVKSLCETSPEQLSEQLVTLNDEQRTQLYIRIADAIATHDSQRTLATGALFHIFECATPELSRTEQVNRMIEETGVSRTQLYRCLGVYRKFGKFLLPNPHLTSMFRAESLKLLSAPSTPEAARQEGIELAKAGEIIYPAVAKRLIAEHQVPDSAPTRSQQNEKTEEEGKIEERIEQARREKQARQVVPLWTYNDNRVEVLLVPVPGRSEFSDEELLYALMHAIEQLKREYPAATIAMSSRITA